MAGFDVKFCDVNLTDLSFDYVKLEEKAMDFRPKLIIAGGRCVSCVPMCCP
jgi:glycine/serine hydroxymethyltransferase